MSIASNINSIKKVTEAHQATLVAVSKTKPNSAIQEAYEAGHRIFGENKVQELVEKQAVLPKDIEWHMIGHMQRNKVKYIAPFVHLIHGVDTIKLLKEINKQGEKQDRILSCLLQVHIAQESTKFGFDQKELLSLLENNVQEEFPFVKIKGLMGMATNTTDQNTITKEFKFLKNLFDQVKNGSEMDILSMGMSGDYTIALEEGSTMVRVGSAIFGSRN